MNYNFLNVNESVIMESNATSMNPISPYMNKGGKLILTNKRLLFKKSGLLGAKIEEFHLCNFVLIENKYSVANLNNYLKLTSSNGTTCRFILKKNIMDDWYNGIAHVVNNQ